MMPAIVVKRAAIYTCILCGRYTEWDESLGKEPLCLGCWDKGVDNWNPNSEQRRSYYQAHRAEISEQRRSYYQAHRAEISEQQRLRKEPKYVTPILQ